MNIKAFTLAILATTITIAVFSQQPANAEIKRWSTPYCRLLCR
jgi:hypothetical protein